uniref:ATP-dependent transporter ycf16 n=1 Tax=Hanusia phi TaxID=3032 RepID=A0A7S0EXI0_9CRYP|mmetsp:Transcript_3353/g.8099  ORF Transcript_3353/g.8099 Transcript_3353/m.8099 type:complete len:1325 (+) Transcript_3353:76-4050(+)
MKIPSWAPLWFRPLVEDEEQGSKHLHPGPLPRAGDRSFLSLLFFSWYNELLAVARGRSLDQEDIWSLPAGYSSEDWARPIAHHRRLWKMMRGSRLLGLYAWCGFLRLCSELGSMASPLLLNQMLKYLSDQSNMFAAANHHSFTEGYMIALLMLLAAVFQSLCLQHYIGMCFECGAYARSTVMNLVFGKVLRLQSSSIQDISSGQLTNLMTKDAAKIQEFILFGHNIWSAPFTAAWVIGMLLSILGWPATAGIVLTIVLIPLQSYIARCSEKFRSETLKYSDLRLKIVGTTLEGIRTVKLSAWEKEVEKKLQAIRQSEARAIRNSAVLLSLNRALMDASPILVALATFAIYTLLGNELTADKAFTSLALFNLLGHPFTVLPKTISIVADIKVTMLRLHALWDQEDNEELHMKVEKDESEVVVDISNMCIGWHPTRNDVLNMTSKAQRSLQDVSNRSRSTEEISNVVIKNANLQLRRGELLVIIGPVASGKSTLLASIAGEAPMQGGTYQLRGRKLGYLPQIPWIKNGTVLENITLASSSRQQDEDDFLAHVVRVTALEDDIKAWPHGIKTEVGERGIQLSGGQKQRIALARLLFARPDVFVLDCPIASLDSRTARFVFEEAIMKTIIGSGATCLMSSNNAWMLEHVNKVAILSKGSLEVTTVSSMESTLKEAIKTSTGLVEEEEEDESGGGEDSKKGGGKEKSKSWSSGKSEKKRAGKLPLTTYNFYFESATWRLTLAVFAFAFLAETFLISKDLVLSAWSDSFVSSSLSNSSAVVSNQSAKISRSNSLLSTYAILCFVAIFCQLVRSLSLALACTNASQSLHDRMLEKVMAAPLSFFESTPVGQITNRFSSDMDGLDFSLRTAIHMAMDMVVTLIGSLFLLCLREPPLILAFTVLFFVYREIQKLFEKAATELKRLDSTTKSPIFTLFSQTVDGISTIRPLKLEDKIFHAMTEAIDNNTAAYLSWAHVNRWLGVRLDFMGALLTFFTALLCLFSGIGSGGIGLLLTYAITITRTLAGSVRTYTQLEVQMNAVERVQEYCNLQPEEEEEEERQAKARALIPPGWPSKGEIIWENVTCRYKQQGPDVLKGISLHVRSSTSVGFCGRTGAGKSSMLMALLRVIPCASGRILLDSVDISQLPLRELRSRIAIIPQDPVQIAQTVREAVDPLDAHSDSVVASVLEEVGLIGKEAKEGEEVKLDTPLKEGGVNLSVGQRQLMCLARALVANKKVLLLDEATAHVDENTATRLRNTMARLRRKHTIIVIAHRLEDVAVCDDVVVLEGGSIAERGAPQELLQHEEGPFLSLVKELGQSTATKIQTIVEEANK